MHLVQKRVAILLRIGAAWGLLTAAGMKKTSRRLGLSRQTLSHLSLASVSGGAPPTYHVSCADGCTVTKDSCKVSCADGCTVTLASCWVSCANGCTITFG